MPVEKVRVAGVIQRKSGAGKDYWIVSLQGDDREFLSFDPKLKNLSGQEAELELIKMDDKDKVTGKDKWRISTPRASGGGGYNKPREGGLPDTERTKYFLLSYAKDLVVASMNTDPAKIISVEETMERLKEYFEALKKIAYEAPPAEKKTGENVLKLINEVAKLPITPEQQGQIASTLCMSKNNIHEVPEDVAQLGLTNLKIFQKICPKSSDGCEKFTQPDKCEMLKVCLYQAKTI